MIKLSFAISFFFAIGTAAFAISPSQPARIVSLAPVATEFLFALGLSDKVVGVTTYCDRPLKAKSIAKIGGFADPQLEAIIKLRPDLVVATPFGNAKNVIMALNSRGIKTLSLSVETLLEMKQFLTALGAATGRSVQAQSLQTQFDDKFTKLKNQLSHPKQRILLLVGSSPLIAAGPSTFPGEIIKHLGAQNTVLSEATAWPVLSLEALIAAPPEVIIVTEGQQGLKAAQASLAPFFSKHKTTRLIAPKESLLQRPGPYLNEEIEALLSLLKGPNV